MGDEPKIPTVEICSYKIQHDDFMPSPTTKQTVEDEEEAKFSSRSIQIEESLLGVNPSPATPEVYEIYEISIRFLSFKQYDLRILTKRITCISINHKRQETQRIFLGETIKEKTPQLPQR